MSNQQAIIDALVESHLQAVTSAQSSPPSQLFLRHLDIVDDHLISSPSTVNTAPSYTATSLLSPSPSSDMEMRQFPGTGKDTKMKPTSAFDWYDGEPIDCDALTKKIPSLRRPNLFATNRLNFKRRQHCDDLNDLDFSLVFEPSSAAGSCSSFTLNDGDVNEMSPPPSPSPTKLTREALRELFLSARIHKQLHHDDSSSPPVPQDDDLSLPSSLSYLPSPFLTSSSSSSSFSALARTCDSPTCASCTRKEDTSFASLFWTPNGGADTLSMSDDEPENHAVATRGPKTDLAGTEQGVNSVHTPSQDALKTLGCVGESNILEKPHLDMEGLLHCSIAHC